MFAHNMSKATSYVLNPTGPAPQNVRCMGFPSFRQQTERVSVSGP